MASTEDKTRQTTGGDAVSAEEELPYSIEVWHAAGSVERVLARAVSLQLARAVFQAVTNELPDRRVTLRKGNRIIADSAR
jgi:uncharacterized membrane protein YhfC